MAEEKSKTPPVILTKSAIAEFKNAVARENQPKNCGLRVLLNEVGNGYRYDLQFETKARQGDDVSSQGGINVYIDMLNASVLRGTRIDFFESAAGSGFLFERPDDKESS